MGYTRGEFRDIIIYRLLSEKLRLRREIISWQPFIPVAKQVVTIELVL